MLQAMDTVVPEYAIVNTVDEFWINLASALGDEMTVREAQAAGIHASELDDERLRLVSTRALIVKSAWVRGWISADEVRLYSQSEAQIAMAAARPWIDQVRRRALEAADRG